MKKLVIEKASNVPIYIQIQDIIRDMISNGNLKPGDSVFSENDLSERLNISRQTVRKAYSELEKIGIFERVHGKGTFIANKVDLLECKKTGTIRNPSGMIGVMFPEFTDFFPNILRGIEEKAYKKGYSINIMFNDNFDKEEQAIRKLLDNNIDGIILTPFRSFGNSSVSNYELLIEQEIPFVMVGKPPKRIQSDAVYCDDIQGSYQAIRQLISLGYKKIIHFTSSQNDREAYDERKEGYILAVEEGLGSGEVCVIDFCEANWDSRLRSVIRNTEDRIGIFTNNDELAALAYNIIQAEGKNIPGDVGILGFNNSSICESLSVKLSSIDHPKQEVGHIAFELLEEKLQKEYIVKPKNVKHIILETQFVMRDSL